jgi:hypothetical protein
MKYLKPLVLESRQRHTLYHFTNLFHFTEMLETRRGFCLGGLVVNKSYVSFTRNHDMKSPELRADKYAVRIVIDGDKLSNKYKITPFLDTQYVDRNSGEWEEKIDVEDFGCINIADCITEINIMNHPLLGHAIKHHYFGNNVYAEKDEDVQKHYLEKLDYIKNKDLSKHNFPINIVSKYTNPKYQERFVLEYLN